MKYVDFCLVAGMHGEAAAEQLWHDLTAAGKSFVVLTENFSNYRDWIVKGIPAVHVGTLCKKFGKVHEGKRAIISAIVCSRFSSESLIKTEQSYYATPKFFLEGKAARLQRALAVFFSEYDVGCVLQRPGGEILRRIFFALSKPMAFRTVVFGESYASGTSVLYSDEYKSLIATDPVFSKEEVERRILARFSNGAVLKYGSKLKVQQPPKAEVLFQLLRVADFNVIWSYFAHRVLNGLVGGLRQLVKSLFYVRELKAPGRMFFVPLNVAAESELFVRNSFFSDQFDTVRKLKHLLPSNSTLYIKEHPGYAKSLSMLEVVQLWLKGVKIIDPKIKTVEILAFADGVIGVSSTVLFEALISGVPFLVIGNWPYSALAGRTGGPQDKQIGEFFLNPEQYRSSLDEISGELRTYLVSGQIYGSQEELRDLANSIIGLQS